MLRKILTRDFLRYLRLELWGMHAPYERLYYKRAFFCFVWFMFNWYFNTIFFNGVLFNIINVLGLVIFGISLIAYYKARKADKYK